MRALALSGDRSVDRFITEWSVFKGVKSGRGVLTGRMGQEGHAFEKQIWSLAAASLQLDLPLVLYEKHHSELPHTPHHGVLSHHMWTQKCWNQVTMG